MCGSAVHWCVCTWVRSKEILVVTDRDVCVEVLYTGVCVLGLGLSNNNNNNSNNQIYIAPYASYRGAGK